MRTKGRFGGVALLSAVGYQQKMETFPTKIGNFQANMETSRPQPIRTIWGKWLDSIGSIKTLLKDFRANLRTVSAYM
jgi:hypothetical protein